MSSPTRLLFIDDDADVQKAAELLLGRHGFQLLAARTPAEAFSVLAEGPVDVVLLDLNFAPGAVSGAEGLRCLEALIALDPDAVVVVVTGHSGVAIAVAAMRAGAADFVMKPWNNDRLVTTLRNAAVRRQARCAGTGAAVAATEEPVLIGQSSAMHQVLALAHRIAPTSAAVLLTGEAGTGKTLLARIIHRHSARADAMLVRLDVAALWAEGEAPLRATLDAIDPQATVWLEEIGDLPPAAQMRLGGWIEAHPQARVLAGARLDRPVLQARLTADLLYRLSTVEIQLPPLRARGTDALELAEHFLLRFARRHGRAPPRLSDPARAAIAAAPWPGNVRELRQAMERAVLLHTGVALEPEDVLPALAAAAPALGGQDASDLNLERAERAAVQAALRRHGFNITRAARELGLTRAALYRRMARHGF